MQNAGLAVVLGELGCGVSFLISMSCPVARFLAESQKTAKSSRRRTQSQKLSTMIQIDGVYSDMSLLQILTRGKIPQDSHRSGRYCNVLVNACIIIIVQQPDELNSQNSSQDDSSV